MFYVVLAVAIITCLYLYRLLTGTSGSQFTDNSIDAFISKEDTTTRNGTAGVSANKYKQNYTEEGEQILIMYGTEYGCCEEIAKLMYDRISDLNSVERQWSVSCFQPRVINCRDYRLVDFAREQICCIVISTSGDGVPPTDAKPFYEFLHTSKMILGNLRYTVLALGDSNYPEFCKTGRIVHEKMADLGCECIVNRHDVDMEDWAVINKWIDKAISYISSTNLVTAPDYIQHADISDELYSRHSPFIATLKSKRLLTVCAIPGDKETIHCEYDISGSGLAWTSGDALGIYPQNNPTEVQCLLEAMHCSGTEQVEKPHWAYSDNDKDLEMNDGFNLFSVLQNYYDLKYVKMELLQSLKENITDISEKTSMRNVLQNGLSKTNCSLQHYLEGREVADVLLDFKSHTLSWNHVLICMKSLQPRYYSISSSPRNDDHLVCVTVAVLRYETCGRSRTGVTTTFLQDRQNVGDKCPVFMSRNPDFRLPSNCQVPVILIGPGTGIAPFIAFIQERALEKYRGPTLLYFGCRHKEKDFLYRSQLEQWASEDVIRLYVAFSRDQEDKLYVQDLIRRDGEKLWQLVERDKASIYVCGDAKHMAHDVHVTLKAIVKDKGNMDDDAAVMYLHAMEECGRYQKDVWVA